MNKLKDIKWNDLTKSRQKKVKQHWCQCVADKSMECCYHCKTVKDFWDNHKEMDYSEWLHK